jgi:hypothetical protein
MQGCCFESLNDEVARGLRNSLLYLNCSFNKLKFRERRLALSSFTAIRSLNISGLEIEVTKRKKRREIKREREREKRRKRKRKR